MRSDADSGWDVEPVEGDHAGIQTNGGAAVKTLKSPGNMRRLCIYRFPI